MKWISNRNKTQTLCRIVFLFLAFESVSISLFAQSEKQDILYRIELKDKGRGGYAVENPTVYLSEKAINRRVRQQLSIDSSDFPIDTDYLKQIEAVGAVIRTQSKWLQTVVVSIPDQDCLPLLKDLTFTDTIYPVWRGNLPLSPVCQGEQFQKHTQLEAPVSQTSPMFDFYGMSAAQVRLNNGHFLHDHGFKAKGISIALLDGGFFNADQLRFFDQGRIQMAKNFTHTGISPFRNNQNHGTAVLSCMLSNQAGELIGTAPEADYYLFLTEVTDDEYLVEEDYLVAALEYADSIGIDVVNISLGYTSFDDPSMNHKREQLDGKSIFSSHAVSIAADKGMLLVVAAGNEGDKDWQKIAAPSDAGNILCVGATDSLGIISVFSPFGPSADGRVKPDVLAMGSDVAVAMGDGVIYRRNGTSYASPIMAGLASCLWEALPHLKNTELIELIIQSASYFSQPDLRYGYGIPDMREAYQPDMLGFQAIEREQVLYFDPGTNRLYLKNDISDLSVVIYSGFGLKMLENKQITEPIDVSFFPPGMYIASVYTGKKQYVCKFIKY